MFFCIRGLLLLLFHDASGVGYFISDATHFEYLIKVPSVPHCLFLSLPMGPLKALIMNDNFITEL